MNRTKDPVVELPHAVKPMNEPKRSRKRQAVTGWIVLLALILPVVLYISTFGFSISDSHTRWAEMGSAMAGIYVPILSFITYLVLNNQTKIQSEMHQLSSNQMFLNQAREDINYYLAILDSELNKNLASNFENLIIEQEHQEAIYEIRKVLSEANVPLKKFYTAMFKGKSIDDLKKLHPSVGAFDVIYPKLRSCWVGIYCYLEIMEASYNDSDLGYNVVMSRLRIASILSPEICTVLDNYVWCLMGGQWPVKYQFSSILQDDNASTVPPASDAYKNNTVT